jgi:thiol-disulfide isomerase/thioredoxin
MKSLSLTAMLLLFGGVAFAQTDYKITGEVPGVKDSVKVVLSQEEGQEPKALSSAWVKDGKFVITGNAKMPRLASLTFYEPGVDKQGKLQRFPVATYRLMVDGTPMTFKAEAKDLISEEYSQKKELTAQITGGEAEAQYAEFLNATRAANIAADSASYAEADAWFDNSGDEAKIKDYKDRANAAKKVYDEAVDAFIFAHPQYPVSAALVAQKYYKDFTYTAEQFDKYLAALQGNPDTLHINFLKKNLDIVKKTAIGARYVDFTAKRPNNQMAKLSSLMKPGKYTLIDFWASWCGPCRSAIPKVKKMAQMYADKLQVISCSLDEKEPAWRKAMSEEKMSWPQMIVPKDVLTKVVAPGYMISSIPRLVLIAPDGGIVVATHDPAIINDILK